MSEVLPVIRMRRNAPLTATVMKVLHSGGAIFCVWLTTTGDSPAATEYTTRSLDSSSVLTENNVSSDNSELRTSQVIVPDWVSFQSLIKTWHEERGVTSLTLEMVLCPSYQRIIAMGQKAVPMILRQLEAEGDEPDMWFFALRVPTNRITDPCQKRRAEI